ncbi:ras-related protein Rab-1A-like [Pecten maximus]|uniref:ras-related protein Rab-1A-like n=1 Tax=Pecten maximus TaxID=6579 RepID=UPI0014580627|nr:ras-related protein Rab-1A-like [Pecten maximus]
MDKHISIYSLFSDYIFKFIVIGDSGVGKSSLLLRFADDVFSDTYISTIGVDFKNQTLKIEDKTVQLQIWDTAGQESLKTITSSFYRGAHGIMLVYDVTDMESFRNLETWIQEVDKYSTYDSPMILVGNKSDMTPQRVVTYTMGKEYGERLGITFMETSAKSSTNVEALFMSLTSEVKSKVDKGELNTTSGDTVIVHSSPRNKELLWLCC